ncbi:hypothetical protein LCGC14_1734500 [marine sediment metagenome]|uniref:Uncharacterized protein n=1 Tax=marine sediment metagenome TaxID=412755 RepID=A0A0F9HWB5_9ZZZZ
MEPITITISWWLLAVPYVIAKIVWAIFLQLRYRPSLSEADNWLGNERGLWKAFFGNILFGLETAILKVLVYPLYWIVVGKLSLKQWILPEGEN